jgi:hypothetical protein
MKHGSFGLNEANVLKATKVMIPRQNSWQSLVGQFAEPFLARSGACNWRWTNGSLT